MTRLLSYDYIYLVPLILSSIISMRSLIFRWKKPLRVFSIFLLATLAIEVLAIVWKWELHKTKYWQFTPSNLWIYNGFITVRHFFYMAFFHAVLKSGRTRRFITWSVFPFAMFSVVNYFAIQTPHAVNTYTIIIANTTTIVLTLAFFDQLLNDPVPISLRHNAAVWIMLGTFIYYSGTLPFFTFFNYLVNENLAMLMSYLLINDALNMVMCVSYLTAYLCKTQFQK